MRLIDADELLGMLSKGYETKRALDLLPTVDLWKYPSKGEYPDKDWSKHPLNVSKKCFVLTKRGVGTIARWDNDYKTWFEKNIHLPVMEVVAWKYFVPPKEEA